MTEIVELNGSFAQQELTGNTPIVRVRFPDGKNWREDVATLNGGGFDEAVLRATKRAMGYPDDEFWQLTNVEVYPGKIDLYCPPKECYPMYSGVAINVVSPEGDSLAGEYQAQESCPNRSLWMVLAFAEVIRGYYTAKGIEAKPFIPAK